MCIQVCLPRLHTYRSQTYMFNLRRRLWSAMAVVAPRRVRGETGPYNLGRCPATSRGDRVERQHRRCPRRPPLPGRGGAGHRIWHGSTFAVCLRAKHMGASPPKPRRRERRDSLSASAARIAANIGEICVGNGRFGVGRNARGNRPMKT